jgi:murein peptide amidase A
MRVLNCSRLKARNHPDRRMKSKEVLFGGIVAFLLFTVCSSGGVGLASVPKKTGELKRFGSELKRHFEGLGWNDLNADSIPWESHRKTQGNLPLMFTTFGGDSRQTVLFLGGVHGDENPSVYIVFRLAQFLQNSPELIRQKKVVIAPLVNPDGFFSRPQRRTNGRGVDINRNFPTKDWKPSKKGNFYSGPQANGESETRFQIALINRFKPTHIISIHSPLGCYDYDGPSSDLDSLVVWLKKVSTENNLPFRRYHVFPGSLGNYAGMERRIHTLTLELPSSDPKKGPEYFDQFKGMFLSVLDLNP